MTCLSIYGRIAFFLQIIIGSKKHSIFIFFCYKRLYLFVLLAFSSLRCGSKTSGDACNSGIYKPLHPNVRSRVSWATQLSNTLWRSKTCLFFSVSLITPLSKDGIVRTHFCSRGYTWLEPNHILWFAPQMPHQCLSYPPVIVGKIENKHLCKPRENS